LHESDVEERADINARSGGNDDKRIEEVEQREEHVSSKPPAAKPNTSIQEASLLLGLRTSSSSSSPATIPTVTDTHSKFDDVLEEMEEIRGAPSGDYTMAMTPDVNEFTPYIPEDYPRRLALPQDRSLLNSLHCYIRSNLLEVFVIEQTKTKTPNLSPSTSLGRVGLRCIHCAEARKRTGICQNEAPMAVFYPKSVSEIYRMVTSWQRCHLRKCRNLPPSVRAEWEELRETDKSRGKTAFWVTSAREIGLVDCPSRAGGVRFAPLSPTKVLPDAQQQQSE
jgi:hypothetical protein